MLKEKGSRLGTAMVALGLSTAPMLAQSESLAGAELLGRGTSLASWVSRNAAPAPTPAPAASTALAPAAAAPLAAPTPAIAVAQAVPLSLIHI